MSYFFGQATRPTWQGCISLIATQANRPTSVRMLQFTMQYCVFNEKLFFILVYPNEKQFCIVNLGVTINHLYYFYFFNVKTK